MTGGTVAIDGVMIVVTRHTRLDLRLGLEAHGRRVALHASDLAMLRVLKHNWSLPTLVLGHANHQGDRAGWGKLLTGMTRCAVAPGGALMMADLAAARRLEGQVAAPRGGAVAGDAGESAMAFMGEGVGGEGRGCARLPRWFPWWCVSLPSRSARLD